MVRKSVIGICAALLVAGLSFIGADTASAGWGPGNGNRSSGYSSRGYGNSGYGNQNYGNQFGRGYGQGGHSNWGGGYGGGFNNSYNKPHYDYHRPSITLHGNHFHVTPGHYDFHQGGHHNHR